MHAPIKSPYRVKKKTGCVCGVCQGGGASTRGTDDRLWTMKTMGLGADLMALTASSWLAARRSMPDTWMCTHTSYTGGGSWTWGRVCCVALFVQIHKKCVRTSRGRYLLQCSVTLIWKRFICEKNLDHSTPPSLPWGFGEWDEMGCRYFAGPHLQDLVPGLEALGLSSRTAWNNLLDEDSLQLLSVLQPLYDVSPPDDAQPQRLALLWPHLHPVGAQMQIHQ